MKVERVMKQPDLQNKGRQCMFLQTRDTSKLHVYVYAVVNFRGVMLLCL